ncbi:MAG TPA: hypothetical protein VOA87_16250 [Thermoanaerobaculia bacterium]|nr:hypothetical protein [Thermoanaerobaculia bacterium]
MRMPAPGLRRAAGALVLGLAACFVTASGLAATVDPFYVGLLRDGIQAYEHHDYPTAARDLRLACFGLLDDPKPLTECFVRLAVAQGAAGDTPGFEETFRRISEVEERFGTYSRAELPPDLRAAFEQRVLATISASNLESMPAFVSLSSRKVEAQISALPPKPRRRDLEARLEKEPRNVTWHLLLVELDLEEGHPQPAIQHAEQAATLAPQNVRALCLRGLARARGGRCQEAVADLAGCSRAASEPVYAVALLGCRVSLKDWRRADDQIKALPVAIAQSREVAPLAREVRQHAEAPPSSGGAGGPKAAPAAGPAPAKPPASAAAPAGLAAAAPPAPLSAADRETMDKVHRLLAGKPQTKDLKQALQLARELADVHADSREAQHLAAEAAYRNSRWDEANTYFRRGGEPGDDRPELLFYLAVARFESGDREGAASALKRSLPNLQKTPYVEAYARRILATGGGR